MKSDNATRLRSSAFGDIFPLKVAQGVHASGRMNVRKHELSASGVSSGPIAAS
jgi:hypothetical protein